MGRVANSNCVCFAVGLHVANSCAVSYVCAPDLGECADQNKQTNNVRTGWELMSCNGSTIVVLLQQFCNSTWIQNMVEYLQMCVVCVAVLH